MLLKIAAAGLMAVCHAVVLEDTHSKCVISLCKISCGFQCLSIIMRAVIVIYGFKSTISRTDSIKPSTILWCSRRQSAYCKAAVNHCHYLQLMLP